MAEVSTLPPPRERRSERIAIFLQPSVLRRVRELAAARGEPPGRVAVVLLETALAAVDASASAGSQ